MTAAARRLLDDALALSEADRAEFAEQLARSLPATEDPIPPPPGEACSPDEWQAAWDAELQRRWTQVESGEARLVPWTEVRERLGMTDDHDAS